MDIQKRLALLKEVGEEIVKEEEVVALLEKHETLAVDVPVMDEGILFDLDTPEDLQYLLSRLKNE